MDAVAAFSRITSVQQALGVTATLVLTAYLFPKQAIVTDQDEFDFIVVGAGSAGAVVAARLAECRHSVLLVDAGGDPPLESLIPSLLPYPTQTQYDWNYTTEKDNYSFQCHRSKTAHLTSGRVLGGGSSINYMLYVRGCPEDFNSWVAASHDHTWSWNEVLQYFIKSENLKDQEIINSHLSVYHGTEGFLGVSRQTSILADKYLESFRELGHDIILDINSNQHLGYNQPMFTISDGVRQSTAYTVLGTMKKRDNLHVLKETLVTKIILNENNNAVGIEAITNDNKLITLKARKEIIVSAGAFNTPRLLMLSGIGPQNHLNSLNIPVRSDLPVGMNLQDNLGIMMAIKLEESRGPPRVQDPHRYPIDVFTGYVALNKCSTCPDYQTINFVIPNDSKTGMDFCVLNFAFDFEICQELYEASKGRRALLTFLSLLQPKSRGRVLLRSNNPSDPPLVHNWYTSDERDLETVVDSIIDFVAVLNTTYFRNINAELVFSKLVQCTGFELWSRDWWRCYVNCLMVPLQHHSGTCALGTVVDSKLRVFGVNRLRVVDASVMPELVRANTNPAIIMIGEKGANFIKQEHCWKSSQQFFLPLRPTKQNEIQSLVPNFDKSLKLLHGKVGNRFVIPTTNNATHIHFLKQFVGTSIFDKGSNSGYVPFLGVLPHAHELDCDLGNACGFENCPCKIRD